MSSLRLLNILTVAAIVCAALGALSGFMAGGSALAPWLSLLAALLLGAAWVSLQRSVLRPFQGLRATLTHAAKADDLSPAPTVEGDDEFAIATRGYAKRIAFTHDGINEMQQCTERLLATAEEVDVATRKISRNSHLQSDASSNMAAAVEQMTVSISVAAEQTVHADRNAHESSAVASEGAADIISTVKGINSISEQVGYAAKHIQELSQDCNSITSMAATIRDIADQTNLLALNAAIEAARAGEQGRGFAVVADEVRKLAERTAKSTQEIGELVTRMQNSARVAVDSMQETEKTVGVGVASAEKAGQSIRRIQEGSASTAQVVSDISVSMQELQKASAEVAKNIEQVAQMSEQNSLAAGASAEAIGRLGEGSRQIAQVLSRFNTGRAVSQRIVLRLADIHGDNHPAIRALRLMGETLQSRSEGRIELKIHTGGSLGTAVEVANQVRAGSIDMMRINMSSLNKDCPLTIVPALPFLFRSEDHMHKALDGAAGDEILASCIASNMVGLAFYDSGARSIYASKPVRRPADTRDMKLRVMDTPLWKEVAKAMGAQPTPTLMDEIVASFKMGLIDAAENNIPSYDSYQHYNAFKCFSHTEHAMVPEIIVFSKKRWDGLAAADQELIREVARASVPTMRKYWHEFEIEARKRASAAGTSFITDVDKQAFQAAMRPVYDKFVTSPEQRALLRQIQELR